MTPLLLFLLGCAVTYLGTVSAAFNALMRLSLRIHAERTDRDDALGRYLEDPRRLFIPARLLISALTVVTAALLARVTGVDPRGFPILILSIIGVVLACEHIIPLIIVRRDPERVLDVLLPSFDAIAGVLRPLTSGLLRLGTSRRRLSQSGVRVNGGALQAPTPKQIAAAPTLEVTEVTELAEASEAEGQARELLRNLADFRDTMVREVMTPRPDIIAIENDATIEQLLTLFRDQQYSRIPVFKETLDNVQGFAIIKDFIGLKPGTPLTGPISPYVRPGHFVPETKRVPDLLKEFQRKRLQSAIVVDEYGGTAGLVTVEDLLEEIVGEIRDEYDVEVERIVDEGQGTYLFSGSAHVEEMGSLMKVNIEGHGFETVGGFLLSRLGRVPAVGEHLEVDGLDVEIVETEQRRITRVRMSRLEPVPSETATGK
ncbi:MAG TPA: hemolysin family protein [Vicinamibacterales bacterium]|nr:hemolysin family protein [Vicinamibacterales bacterium]